MFCPDLDKSTDALLALLPPGRAWQSNEGGPEPYHDAAFDPRVFDPEAFDATDIPGSVLYRYWRAVAHGFAYASRRVCALVNEFFCPTVSETKPEWLTEYQLPDACDPFPDLCDKVRAKGSGRCEYFNERIARMGWTAECFEKSKHCGAIAGCARTGQRKAVTGDSTVQALVVRVHTNEAPLITPAQRIFLPIAGSFRAGHRPSCATPTQPPIEPIRCLMERIVPAHIVIDYVH